MKLLVLVLMLFAPGAHFQEKRYYWQDYTGEIPENALEGGYTANGSSIYIGQVTTCTNETVPVTLHANSTSVQAVSLNKMTIEAVNSSIKILCGDYDSVNWQRANFDNLQVQLIGSNPIIGGGSGEDDIVYIGRVFYKNAIRIGPVPSSIPAYFSFAHNKNVYSSGLYEVMVFQREGRKKRPPFRRGHPKRHN